MPENGRADRCGQRPASSNARGAAEEGRNPAVTDRKSQRSRSADSCCKAKERYFVAGREERAHLRCPGLLSSSTFERDSWAPSARFGLCKLSSRVPPASPGSHVLVQRQQASAAVRFRQAFLIGAGGVFLSFAILTLLDFVSRSPDVQEAPERAA
jgi:hypothetical protein